MTWPPFADEAETWLALAADFEKRNLAYVHLSDQLSIGGTKIPEHFAGAFRDTYRGPLIAAGGFDRESGERALASGELDLIAIGRPFISNPDLIARMKNGWPITTPDRATWYGDLGASGYTDYPTYQQVVSAI
jgi:2,4-dienoyl-CoA reductase-like NADH-dependent reductase (Old Yellow Enzyme family)